VIILANFLAGIAAVLSMVLTLMIWILVIRALISWVNPDPFNPIVRFLTSVTDPLLIPLRRRIPLAAGAFDFSPIVLLLILVFLQYFLVETLKDYADQLRRKSMTSQLQLPQKLGNLSAVNRIYIKDLKELKA
jgi:YggT family protein